MHEIKQGKLKTGFGKKVDNHKQAIAIWSVRARCRREKSREKAAF